jgi:hypothetical protein
MELRSPASTHFYMITFQEFLWHQQFSFYENQPSYLTLPFKEHFIRLQAASLEDPSLCELSESRWAGDKGIA